MVLSVRDDGGTGRHRHEFRFDGKQAIQLSLVHLLRLEIQRGGPSGLVARGNFVRQWRGVGHPPTPRCFHLPFPARPRRYRLQINPQTLLGLSR